ncbi:MAG: CapA family protein [Actinobacteria bacterium ATB1]|nr:CapA family protein [Actinobacteria bacterium ATB1]
MEPKIRPVRRAGPILAFVLLAGAVMAGVTWSGGVPAHPPARDTPSLTSTADLTAAEPEPSQPVTFTWVGDMMIGSTTPSPELPPNGARNTFDAVRDLLLADVTMGNLEGPLTETGPTDKCRGRTDCYMFSQPPEYAAVYRDAGFDIVNLANNHTMDRGREGVDSTRTALDSVGIRYAGLPETVARVEVDGTSVAALGFSHYRGSETSTDLTTVRSAVANAEGESDLVVVFFHGGLEGPQGARISTSSDPGVDVVAFAHAAVEAGADLVLGSGPHVLRGIEFHQGRLIAYSLGNFATYGKFSLAKDELRRSAVLEVKLNPDGTFAAGRVKPAKLTGEGVPVPGGRAIPFMQDLSESDFGPSAAEISDDGTINPPAQAQTVR